MSLSCTSADMDGSKAAMALCCILRLRRPLNPSKFGSARILLWSSLSAREAGCSACPACAEYRKSVSADDSAA